MMFYLYRKEAPVEGFALTHAGSRLRRRQSGVVLIFALIALVAMTLASIALVRSVETSNIVAGNLAFKQGATAAGDAGTEAAIGWLRARIETADLYTSIPVSGYYSTRQETLDITGSAHDPNRALVDWDFNGCNGADTANCVTPAPAITVGDNTVTYIIHRLCETNGDKNLPTNSCATYKAKSLESPKRGEIKYGDDKRFEPPPVEYYRITSRVKGPRNTISFVEATIRFYNDEKPAS